MATLSLSFILVFVVFAVIAEAKREGGHHSTKTPPISVVVEDQKTASLKCPANTMVKVHSAKYTGGSTAACADTDVLILTRQKCRRQEQCDVKADDQSPCKPRSLQINYRCVTKKPKPSVP